MNYNIKISIVFLAVICCYACQNDTKSNLTVFSDKIPTDTALVFGKDVISTADFEFAITFNPTMDELFFTRRKPEKDNEIYHMKFVDGKWSTPTQAFFKAKKGWDFEPHINPQGNRLYFGSTRPLHDTLPPSGLHQWYSEKSTDGWSLPTPVETPFSNRFAMYVTAATNGTLYFTAGEKDDKPEDWCIYKATKEKEGYSNFQRMNNKVNFKGKWIAHPYIAPDESYIIYDGEQETGFGENDLYISFNQNGMWTKAFNLGASVNTPQTEMCPTVSPDGKYLFFHRGGEEKGNIYWIDFKILKEKILDQITNN